MNRIARQSIFFLAITFIATAFLSAPAALPVQAQSTGIGWPFPDCETWYVLQGYDSLTWSHQGTYALSMDLLKDFKTDDSHTGNARVVAPMSGVVDRVYSLAPNGWGVAIHDGTYEFQLNHLNDPSSYVWAGKAIAKGDTVGYILDVKLGGYKHMDIALKQLINGSYVRIPLDIPGTVWQFPRSGPSDDYNRGTWAGAELKTSCDSTPPTGGYDEPADGTTITSEVMLRGHANDDSSGVDHVNFTANYDGVWHVVYTDNAAPYEYRWDTTGIADQDITLGFDIYDKAGNGALAPEGTRLIHKVTISLPPAADQLRVVKRSPSTITLAWRDNATNESEYRIYRWDGWIGSWVLVGTVAANVTTFTDTNLDYPLGYSYAVAAANSAGETSSIALDAFIANAINDLDNDGISDVFWRHATQGTNRAYLLNGATVRQIAQLGTITGQAWRVVGTGDFNGDGYADMLWRNATTGQNALYFYQGATRVGGGTINQLSDANWRVAGVADVDKNGRADIIWRNQVTGKNAIYLMDGLTIVSQTALPTLSDVNWQLVGFDDFNADGRADMLWHHKTNGANAIFFMEGAAVKRTANVAALTDVQWQVAGVGDMNADGRADILWRHATTGQNMLFLMNGEKVAAQKALTTVGNINWKVKGTADYDRDGTADIFWRNTATGSNTIFFLQNGAVRNTAVVTGMTDLNWLVVGTGSHSQGAGSVTIAPADAQAGADDMQLSDGADLMLPALVNVDTFFDRTADTSTLATMDGDPNAVTWLGPEGEPRQAPPEGQRVLPGPTGTSDTRVYLPMVGR